jgi:ketosteroid isomerase-like protein
MNHTTTEDEMDKLTQINAQAAQRLFEAVEHRSREGVMALYHENIVINEAPRLPYGGEFLGHEGALRHGQGFRAAWDRFQPSRTRGLEPRFIAQGEHVAVLWRHRAENHETGERIDLPAAGVYRFVDGKVVNSRMFHFDIAALLRFLNGKAPG